jgi:hypothetical protein
MAPPCLLAPAPLTPSATQFLIALRAIRIVPNPFLCTTDTRSNRHKSRIFSTPSSNKRRTYTKVRGSARDAGSGSSPRIALANPLLIRLAPTRNTSRPEFPVTHTKQSHLIFLPETGTRIVATSPARPCFEPPTSDLELLIDNMIIRIGAKSFAFFRDFISNRQFPRLLSQGRSGPLPAAGQWELVSLTPFQFLNSSVFICVHPWILIGLFSAPIPFPTVNTCQPPQQL